MSGSTTEAGAARRVTETPLAGDVPRFEIPGWRESHGIAAGVTGRGSGAEPFDLGLWSRTPVGTAMERWRTFRSSLPEFPSLILGMQVHGAEVRWHGDPGGWLLIEGVDGHATGATGVLLSVTIADCVPVYLADPVGRRVALLHAGWRGLAAGILEAGVGLLSSRGSSASDILMHCGVSICGTCYEVGSEVFVACGAPPPHDGRGPIDLRAILAARGAALGLRQVSTSGLCTAHDSVAFFSHRCSRGADGRMVAYLGLLP